MLDSYFELGNETSTLRSNGFLIESDLKLEILLTKIDAEGNGEMVE